MYFHAVVMTSIIVTVLTLWSLLTYSSRHAKFPNPYSPSPSRILAPHQEPSWSVYWNDRLGYEISYPPHARLIHPSWGTIVGENPSDIIVKFNLDSKCLDHLGRHLESTYVECSGDDIDIVFLKGRQASLRDLVDADLRKLGRPTPCTTTREELGEREAIRVSQCLVGRSSFYYLKNRARLVKIAVSDTTDPTAQAILATLKFR